MGRTHSRLGMYALAVLTCFALFGAAPAFAANKNQPRVNGAGWYQNFGEQEVKFGITANFNGNVAPQGRFEIFNAATGASVTGKITSWTFIADGACGGPPPAGFQGPPAGAPGASLHGTCDNGSTCTFDMNVVDGGQGGKSGNDFVCRISVNGTDKKNRAINESQDPPQSLLRGKIDVKNSQ